MSISRLKKSCFISTAFRLRKAVYQVSAFLVLLAFAFCMSGSLNAKDAEEVAVQWPDKLVIGFIPYLGVEETAKKYQPLIEHLSNVLGVKVEIMVPDNYIKVIAALKKKEVHFAYTGSNGYTAANRLTGAIAIAMELDKHGNPGYNAILISSKQSGIENIDDAKGKIMAFTDPESTSGYLVPFVYFIREKRQIPASFASKIVFAGSHADVIRGIAEGKYSIGATNNMDLEATAQTLGIDPERFNVLWRSQLIPGAPMVARSDMPQDLVKAFLDALISVNEQKQALEKMQIGGFTEAKDSDYDMIRGLEALKTR